MVLQLLVGSIYATAKIHEFPKILENVAKYYRAKFAESIKTNFDYKYFCLTLGKKNTGRKFIDSKPKLKS